MNKRQLIDEIRQFNVTVQVDFLAQFDDAALKQYLENLKAAQDKRLQISTYVRRESKLRLVS
jgi:hypothetical protein